MALRIALLLMIALLPACTGSSKPPQPAIAPQSIENWDVGPNGEQLLTLGDRRLVLWELGETPHPVKEVEIAKDSEVAFCPDGAFAATGGIDRKGVYLWKLPDLEQVRSWEVTARELAWSPDGKVLAGVTSPMYGGGEPTLYAWNRITGSELWHTEAKGGGELRFAPGGYTLLLEQPTEPPCRTFRSSYDSSSGERTMLHDEQNGGPPCDFPEEAYERCRAFATGRSAQGDVLAVHTGSHLRLWFRKGSNSVTPGPTITLTAEMSNLKLSPDGNLVGMTDGSSVSLWDVKTGDLVHQVGGPK